MRRTLGPLLVLISLLAPAAAQAAQFPRAKAVRIDAPPVIDGRFDDPAWQQTPTNDSFTQVSPDQGAKPSERTQFRLAYDDQHLYIAVDCFDSNPGGIVSRLTRRDRDIEADWLSVSIDSRNDRNSAFLFQLSAAGVKVDGQVFANTNVSLDWDAVWEGSVTTDADGWHAEFAIPLTVLRFSSADVQTWGLQVHRNVSRKREQMMWSYDGDSSDTWGVSRFGYIEGLAGLEPRRTFELRPYFATTMIARTGEGGGLLGLDAGTDRDGRIDVGVDAKIGVTPRLTLDLTVNPDFGQVEADQVVLNLSRFETFFPEKRPFFLEGQDIFSTTIQLFYPRRIGRPAVGLGPGAGVYDPMGAPLEVTAAPGSLRLWTAAKLTGEVSDKVSLGVLGALVGAETVDVIDPGGGETRSLELAPLRGYGVLRTRYALGGGKFVGFTATSVTRLGGDIYRASADHDAYVQAFDVFWISDDRKLTAQAQLAASERVGGPGYRLGDGRACSEADSLIDFSCVPIARADGTRMGPGSVGVGLQARGQYQTRSRVYKIEYTGHTAAFDPNDAGFAPRFNLNELKLIGGLMKTQPDEWTNFRGVFPFFVGSMSMEGTQQYALLGADLEATFKNFTFVSPEQWILLPGGNDIYETFDGARFTAPPAWEGVFNAGTNPAKVISGFVFGQWYVGLGDEARSYSAELGVNWQAASNIELSLAPGAGMAHEVRFYDCTTDSGRSCLVDAGLRHYLFADLDSRYFSLTLRGTWTLRPELSLQAYAQYFAADGDFSDYREIDTTGDHPTIDRDQLMPSAFDGDFDGDGVADDGFEDQSLNVNLVLRWEPVPGSTLYAVYTRGQQAPHARLSQLDRGPTEEVLLLKFAYFVE